jgi:hypothetical protein
MFGRPVGSFSAGTDKLRISVTGYAFAHGSLQFVRLRFAERIKTTMRQIKYPGDPYPTTVTDEEFKRWHARGKQAYGDELVRCLTLEARAHERAVKASREARARAEELIMRAEQTSVEQRRKIINKARLLALRSGRESK